MGGWIERLVMAALALSRAMCLQLLLRMRIALVGVAVRAVSGIYSSINNHLV
jgi:hypothetical protein